MSFLPPILPALSDSQGSEVRLEVCSTSNISAISDAVHGYSVADTIQSSENIDNTFDVRPPIMAPAVSKEPSERSDVKSLG